MPHSTTNKNCHKVRACCGWGVNFIHIFKKDDIEVLFKRPLTNVILDKNCKSFHFVVYSFVKRGWWDFVGHHRDQSLLPTLAFDCMSSQEYKYIYGLTLLIVGTMYIFQRNVWYFLNRLTWATCICKNSNGFFVFICGLYSIISFGFVATGNISTLKSNRYGGHY